MFKQLLQEYINREVKKVLNEESKGIKLVLDEMSKITLRSDKGECNFITEAGNPLLKNRNWEINNYDRFLDIVNKTPHKYKGYLTSHGMDEITGEDWITYTLKGKDIAFALHYLSPGQVELCNLVNNSDLKGAGDSIVQFAKQQGATQMDNFRGFKSDSDPQGNGKLGTLYRRNGFNKQTWHDKFNPEFQPSDPEWQLDKSNFKDGEGPDVEGLELSKHKMKYNRPNSNYKEKWDKRIGSKFGK